MDDVTTSGLTGDGATVPSHGINARSKHCAMHAAAAELVVRHLFRGSTHEQHRDWSVVAGNRHLLGRL